MKIALICIASVTAAVAAPALAATAPARGPAPAGAQADATDAYVLGAADVIEVSVLGRPDFTTRGRVDEDGTIQLPFIGKVHAGGRTRAQFGSDVATALERGGYFQHPIVSVDVVSYASRYVTVLGDVANPGLVPVDRSYRVSEILARVGGVKDTAADYVVLRPRNGGERKLPIEALAQGGAEDDPYVAPGDKLYSPAAEEFFISGEVKSPGTYPLKPGMTVRMALSRGGGLTELGSDHRIKITRGGKPAGKVSLDSAVQPGDVIVVGERLF